jgi:tetratricopeptide (TPR) repeat protein
MKKFIGLLVVVFALNASAQSNSELLKHYENYYLQMKKQGDVQGVINAMTHLNILSPSQERTDTLAVLYMNDGKHIQALNTIGIEKNASDSDMAVEVKAVCLQAINQPVRAIEQFEELYKRSPNPLVAYELADLKIQTNDLSGANLNITFGIANSDDEIMRTFYESQTPYQVSIKAAFTYLKGLVKYREDTKANIDAAIAILDEALVLAPNFNLAKISKDALLAQKNAPVKED